jgi:hypothetical protein
LQSADELLKPVREEAIAVGIKQRIAMLQKMAKRAEELEVCLRSFFFFIHASGSFLSRKRNLIHPLTLVLLYIFNSNWGALKFIPEKIVGHFQGKRPQEHDARLGS